MGKSGGARDGPSGSAAGGLAAVAEIEGADVAPASSSSSPAATRQEHLQQEHYQQQRLAQEHLQQQMLAAQAQAAQLAQLFPGGLHQLQSAIPALVGGNAPPPPSADLMAALSQLDSRLATSFTALDARLQPLEAGLRSTQAAQNAARCRRQPRGTPGGC